VGGARSEDVILQATLDLVAEHGVSGVTVDAVAARAGVGKATIYRHWGSRARLVHAAISCMKDPLDEPDSGSLRGDLTSLVEQIVRYLNQEHTARVLPSLIDAAVRDAELAELRLETIRGRRAAFARAIERAIERGELPDGVDVQLMIDLVVAPFFYRRLMALTHVRASDVEPVVDAVLRAFTAVPATSV
jgi:AcrR family transcriptional regulator